MPMLTIVQLAKGLIVMLQNAGSIHQNHPQEKQLVYLGMTILLYKYIFWL